MKANELMIGDWVNYRPCWINEETGNPEYECGVGFPVKLTCIYDGLAQYDDILPDGTINTIEVADYELSGIPITPEILEKNGFHKTSLSWIIRDGFMGITFQFLKGKWSFSCRNEIQKKDEIGRADLVSINRDWCSEIYIHELQHALRLCGIDKEIEL